MMKYLLVSSLIFLLTGCATTSQIRQTTHTSLENSRLWTDELRDNENVNQYRANIQVRGNHISGMCMLKKSEDSWRGTLNNEFGIKAFDFIVTPKKCELLNTISLMNKWYIRRTIAGDLYFLFEIDNPDVAFQKKTVRYEQNGTLEIRHKKNKSIIRMPDNSIQLTNLKRNIVYSLTLIPE